MMSYLHVPLLLLSLATTGVYSQTVDVTCAIGPEYSVTVTGGSDTGAVYILDNCAQQTTSSTETTYTFGTTECTTVPAIGTEFYVVVQTYASIATSSDVIYAVTCDLETSVVEQTSFTAATLTSDGTLTPMLAPTISIAITDSTDSVVTSGTLGDEVTIGISVPAEETSTFGFLVDEMAVALDDATTGPSVTLLTGGCTGFSSIVTQPAASSGGSLDITFVLVIPVRDTDTTPSVPVADAGDTLIFVFTLTVCDGTCSEPTCGRRRRSADVTNSTVETIKMASTFTIYPPGHTPDTQGQVGGRSDGNICMSKTPLIGVMVALSTALVVCLCITAWMFTRLRRPLAKPTESHSGFCNSSYKA